MSDICLLLEGTYPYVTGGVSSCVHQLIEETPHLSYSLVFIGPTKEHDAEYKYKIPSNVRVIKELYLFEDFTDQDYEPEEIGLNTLQKEILANSILFGKKVSISQLYTTFFDPNRRICDPEKLFFSKEVWDIIEQMYYETFDKFNAPSFIDFFYTWRFTNYPIFKVLSMDIPKANVYHTKCTGYAGLLGCVAKEKYHNPLILTEHGIYTHERKIEITQSQWLYTNKNEYAAKQKLSYFKNWWYSMFKNLGELCYDRADTITTLYEGNVKKQIELGAPARKIHIIPNGINSNKLKRPPNTEDKIYKKPEGKIVIGLVGRVVPIKDIKTFIKSISYLLSYTKDIHVLIMGPTDEDEEYYKDCVTLAKLLEVEDYIEFTEKVDLRYYYPSMDIIVLSSISEGQPLVLLEAFCFGIPAICTDVGSCSELIHGRGIEDKSLGICGVTVPFGMSDKLGQALYDLINDEDKRIEMGKIAIERYDSFYQEKYTINNYLSIYNKHLLSRV